MTEEGIRSRILVAFDQKEVNGFLTLAIIWSVFTVSRNTEDRVLGPLL